MKMSHYVFVAASLTAGCATSQDLAGMRQDVQKEVQDLRAKQEQSMLQSESKRKAAEEIQVQIVKAFEAQAHTLASLSAKVQDLQSLQESLQKERVAAQGTNVALRDAILRSLKAEQSDLQQRLKSMTDYIKEIEQASQAGAVAAPPPVAAPPGKGPVEGPSSKGPDGAQPQK